MPRACGRCAGISVARVIAWAPAKTERGSRHPGLPLFRSPFGSAGSTGCRRTSYDPPYYCAAASDIGRTDTNTRPLVLVRNSILPLINANNVWSLPMPTLRPACHLVPRWRAMMLPASTAVAAENLQPQTLTGRIAAVARGSACFLVCHCWPPNLSVAITYTGFVTKASLLRVTSSCPFSCPWPPAFYPWPAPWHAAFRVSWPKLCAISARRLPPCRPRPQRASGSVSALAAPVWSASCRRSESR